MKKVITMLLLLALASSSMYACGDKKFELGKDSEATEAPVAEEVPVEIKSYADFEAAENLSLVKLETYVQGKQLHAGNKCGLYVENEAGDAYYLFQAGCSKEQYDAMVPGTKISAIGRKSAEWGDIIEIVDAKIEILEGSYVAPTRDITDLLGDEEALKAYRNKKVNFTYLDVSAVKTAQGAAKDELHLVLSNGEKNMTFYLNSQMAEHDSLVYQNASSLVAAVDKVDVTCFIEWNDGMKPMVVSALGHIDTDSYVQHKSPLIDGKCSMYIQTDEAKSGYRVIDMECTQELYDQLSVGTPITISGLKSGGNGKVEIMNAAVAVRPDVEPYDATPENRDNKNTLVGKDINEGSNINLFGQNYSTYLLFMKLDIKAVEFGKGEGGKDIKITFNNNGGLNSVAYVEAAMVGEDSDTYKTAAALQVGDTVKMYGYLFFDNLGAMTVLRIEKQ